VKPLLILVEPPQVSSLDPQKYLCVVLIVVLFAANADAPIFSWRPHAGIISLHFNQNFVVVRAESMYARYAVDVAIFIDSV